MHAWLCRRRSSRCGAGGAGGGGHLHTTLTTRPRRAAPRPFDPALENEQELQPYIQLSEGLGKAAVGLVADTGFTDIAITYSSPRGDDLDTRLLRAMVIKGVLEEITTSNVSLVSRGGWWSSSRA